MACHESLEDCVRIARPRREAGIGRNAHRYEAGRWRATLLRHTFQRLRHEIDPHWQRGAAAFLTRTERALLIETDPRGADQRRVEAAEPGVATVVGRAGLAGDVTALELQRAHRCA